MSAFKTIIESIETLNTKEDLVNFHKNMQLIYDAWDSRQNKINSASCKALSVGDAVSVFHPSKNRNIANGVVKKIKRKNVIVEGDNGNLWDVPASLCTKLTMRMLGVA